MSDKLPSKRHSATLSKSNHQEMPAKFASEMDRLRSAVAGSEHEDARLTGMTRSLDRRLLALNLQTNYNSKSALSNESRLVA